MIEFTVPAMRCGHCVGTVTETVRRIDPAATVDVDLQARKVSIASALPAPTFAAALTEEGYAPA